MIDQLKSLINSDYETVEDMQKALSEAMPTIEGEINKGNTQRKELGKKADELVDLKKAIGAKLGLDDVNEASIGEAIEAIVANGDKAEEIEALRESLSKKYESDIEQLRSELNQKETFIGDLTQKHNDALFDKHITSSGLLEGFVDEPMARNMVISQIKEKLIYDNGNVYVKDSASGDIAKDIRTGEPLKPESVVSELKKTISPMYLVSETTAQGGGTPPSNQTTTSTTTVDTSKHRSTHGFINEAMSAITQQ